MIKEFEEKHAKSAAILLKKIYSKSPRKENRSEENALSRIFELTRAKGAKTLILIENDIVKGFINANPVTYASGKTYNLNEFFLDESIRKTGEALKLYEKLKEICKKDADGFFFTTLKNTEAYGFYKKAGATELKDSAVFYHFLK